MSLRILCLEDNPTDAALLREHLLSEGLDCNFVHVNSKSAFEKALEENCWDCILSDYSLPGYSGIAAVGHARVHFPNLPAILVSGTISEAEAVESLRAGAIDYIIKSRLERLKPAILRAVKEAREKAERLELERQWQAQRKQAEARILEQATLLDKASDAICLWSMDFQVRYWNQGAERLYGWKSSEIMGRKCSDVLFPSDTSLPERIFPELLSRDEWVGELEQKSRNEKKIIVQSRWTLMRDQSGQPQSVLMINTDVTEKRHYEAEWLRTQRVETIGALAGTIAHDLNNFLAPIIMASDFLEDQIHNDQQKAMLAIVKKSANQCAQMVRQILTFSRGGGRGRELVESSELIQQIETLARQTLPRTIRLQTDVPPGCYIHAEVTQMHQLFMNLIVNARDAMEQGGAIFINADKVQMNGETAGLDGVQMRGPYIRLHVRDTGAGIPPEIAKTIFEPFFTTKAQGKGTGLGLSTVVGILKNHNGFLELESTVGQGTCFKIYLPESLPQANSHGSARP